MMQPKHATPHPEWAQMYDGGLPAKTISTETGVAQSVIRHHLAIAATQDPGLRDAHRSAAGPVPTRVTVPGRRNMGGVLAFHQAEGRLPVHGPTPRETALADRLARRRRDAVKGPSPPCTPQGWTPSRAGRTTRPNTTRTRPDGRSVSPRSPTTWRPATSFPGTTRPTTSRSAPWASACTASGSRPVPGR